MIRITSASSFPSIATSLSREPPPRATETALAGTPSLRASSRHSASFAFPLSGAARTLTRSVVPCHARIASSRPPGVTRTFNRATVLCSSALCSMPVAPTSYLQLPAIIPLAMPELREPRSAYYDSQRIRLHYAVWGDSSQPSLLLIHGGQDHCRNW